MFSGFFFCASYFSIKICCRMTQMQEQNKPKCICNDAKILGVGDDAIWTQGLAICLSTDSNKFAKHKRPLEQQKTGTKIWFSNDFHMSVSNYFRSFLLLDLSTTEPEQLLASICQHLSPYPTHCFWVYAWCWFGFFYNLVKQCYKLLGQDPKPAL